jgi:Zn-dependent protease with chaperone function
MIPLLPVAIGGILASLVAQYGTPRPASAATTVLAAVALAPAGFLLAALAARVGAPGVLGNESDRALRRYTHLVKLPWVLLLAAYAWVVQEGGLAVLAHGLGGLAEGPALLAPWVLACFALWSGHDEGERIAVRRAGLEPLSRRRVLGGRARRVLVPLAAFLLLDVALGLVLEVGSVREALDLHPRARSLVLGGGVLLLFGLAPLVMRLLFQTRPMAIAGAPYPTRLWDLGPPVATASVAGVFPFYRTIFVTPRLLEVMDAREGSAVLRHEIGHATLGHLRVLALAASALVVGIDDLSDLGVSALGLVALGAVAFVALARRLEHDADLHATATAPDGGDAIASALLKCCAVNGQSPERGGIRHPSVARRIALVQQAASDPRFAARRLRRSELLLGAMSALAVLVIARGGLLALDEARSPLGPRLLAAARERLEQHDHEIARGYAERARATEPEATSVLQEIERASR